MGNDETYLVSRGHPLALGHEGSGLLVDLGLGGGNLVLYTESDKHSLWSQLIYHTNTYHSEVLEGTGSLDVLQGLLQVDQLSLNLALGLLSVLDSLGLEGIDGLQLAVDIVGGGLEVLEVVLDLVDDGLVLEDVPVVGEVNGLRLLGKDLDLAAGVIVALLEGLERSGGLAAEAERGRHLDPVDFESGAALLVGGLCVSGSDQCREWGALRILASMVTPTAAIVTGGKMKCGGGEKRGEVDVQGRGAGQASLTRKGLDADGT